MLPALLPLLTAIPLGETPDTTRYVVLNHGREAGDMIVVEDEARVGVRYIYTDRNRGSRVNMRYRLSPAGDVLAFEARPIGEDGEAGEPEARYEVSSDSVRWQVGDVHGSVATGEPVFFRTGATTPFHDARLAGFLLEQPDRSTKLLPSGSARLEMVADTVVRTASGRQRVRLVMLHGLRAVPQGLWLTEDNRLFATEAGWFITVLPEAIAALPTLRTMEIAYQEARDEDVAREATEAVSGALVIRNGDVFDSESGEVWPRMTVVVEGDRIAAVGAADEVEIPAAATVIDATGKTVIPGMWDMHVHLIQGRLAYLGGSKLAAGITTVRDLAADLDIAVSHRERADAGVVASPRVLLGGFIEGPGAWAGPTEAIAGNEAEARAWVARYDSLEYRQIKLYNLIHPDLVPTIAEEAHARGMRLSGHVPRGLSTPAAIKLGYDEINHAAFLFSTFFPDSLFTPRMRAYSAVAAAVAPGFPVDGPDMTALIDVLRENGTVIDGTFAIWMGAGTLTGGGTPASASYGRLLKRLFDAGVTLVPGTDAQTGGSFLTELELYEHVGIPAPDVLRMATLTSARVMGEDRDYGSIAPGKVADVVIVDGQPAERIADLRAVETVIRAGRLYNSADLRSAIGEGAPRRLRRERG